MDALASLHKVCGEEHVRPGAAADAVDGVVPAYVAAPASTDEIRELVLVARDAGLRVGVRGASSKLGWGMPPAGLDLLLDLSRQDRVLEHAAGDLVVRVEPGVRLVALREHLAPARQQLALDPPEPGATVGGVIGANASGPSRLLYGTARDLLIGITVVLADGTVARAGGKVVKNVAGYDISKLYIGAVGTLGLVTEAIFRLHPVPAARRVVTVEVATAADAGRLTQLVTDSQLVPTALELDWPDPAGPGRLTVVVEGIEPGATSQAESAAGLLGGGAEITDTVPAGWGQRPYGGETGPAIGLKVSAEPAALRPMLDALWRVADLHHLATAVRSSAGSGVSYVGLGAAADAGRDAGGPAVEIAATVIELRAAVAPYDGSVVVLQAPPEVKRLVDVWGPVPAVELMRRIKDRFDPEHRMSPGRFVGGI